MGGRIVDRLAGFRCAAFDGIIGFRAPGRLQRVADDAFATRGIGRGCDIAIRLVHGLSLGLGKNGNPIADRQFADIDAGLCRGVS